MKDFLRCILIIFVVCGVIAIAILGGIYDAKTTNKNWNNGICEVCGGDYKFKCAVHLKNGGDTFYYSCEDCDHTINTRSLMK